MKNTMIIAMLNAAIALHKRIEIGPDDEYPWFNVPICVDDVYDPDTAAKKLSFAMDIIQAAMSAMGMPIEGYVEIEQVFYDYGYGKKTVEEAYASVLKVREEFVALMH